MVSFVTIAITYCHIDLFFLYSLNWQSAMEQQIQSPDSPGDTHTGFSEMRAELMDRCEEQFGLLQKVNSFIIGFLLFMFSLDIMSE